MGNVLYYFPLIVVFVFALSCCHLSLHTVCRSKGFIKDFFFFFMVQFSGNGNLKFSTTKFISSNCFIYIVLLMLLSFLSLTLYFVAYTTFPFISHPHTVCNVLVYSCITWKLSKPRFLLSRILPLELLWDTCIQKHHRQSSEGLKFTSHWQKSFALTKMMDQFHIHSESLMHESQAGAGVCRCHV